MSNRAFDRTSSESLEDELNRYRRKFYEKNIALNQIPEGRAGLLHQILAANDGEVPAAETLRKRAREAGDSFRKSVPKSHATTAA